MKEGLDDQRQHAGDDDAVHPLERIDLRLDDREFFVEPCDVVFDLRYSDGILLDPLKAVVAQDKALGRGARLLLGSAGLLSAS